MHLYPQMLPRVARCLGNQVIGMIAEYHMTSSARISSSLCLVLLEAAKPLLPPIKSYVPGVAFEGTWDVRILDCAKTLWVAAWLHQLDMSTGGDGMASETLEASRHSLGPLLESFLAPMRLSFIQSISLSLMSLLGSFGSNQGFLSSGVGLFVSSIGSSVQVVTHGISVGWIGFL